MIYKWRVLLQADKNTKIEIQMTRAMNLVEQQLEEKSRNAEQSILNGQWQFDKVNIPNALKAVSGVFPHYSLHDETHSESIINNIVRMLGQETIKSLSCTDLWMLLECAYSHDLGMAVTASRVTEVLTDGSFLKYFMKICTDKDHPCYLYTQHFDVKEGKIYQKEAPLDVDAIDSIRFLLADFFRKLHPTNSQRTINSPVIEAGIESPRSVIPTRLYIIIGKICKAHGQAFDDVMSLPMTEDGIGLEECHPRFIACMLRLGDLLDIDNNRFSEALNKTIKDLPVDSKLHKEKHKSITHLSINTRSIEIEAECQSPKVAQVTQDWFNWISDEFKTQTLKWNSIVPEGLNCYLPTLNYLRIKIAGYVTLNTSEKPKFTIDTDKALELLQGKNFYKDIFEAVREILQNAVDSTLLRIYLDSKKEGKTFTGINRDFLEYASNYPIEVRLKTSADGDYIVSVSDRGMGLKPEYLTYLINSGSSSKNVEKKLIIDEMPEWMRPSGVFGIGFQSIFLLTDKVEITTKDYYEDKKMHIELYSPNSPMKGDIFLKEVKESYKKGLTIQFTIKKGVKFRREKDIFDSIPNDIDRTFVEEKIREYASMSFVPVKLYVDDKDVVEIERQKFVYYDPDTKVELGFTENVTDLNSNSHPTFYYRNAKVSSNSDIKFIAPLINVHLGDASKLLTIDRSSLRSDIDIDLSTLVSKTMVNFINSPKFNNYMKTMGDKQSKALFKLLGFVEYVNLKDKIKSDDASRWFDIQEFSLKDFGYKDKTIHDVVNYKKIHFKTVSERPLSLQFLSNDEIIIEANTMPFGIPSILSDIIILIFKLAYDKHTYCYCVKNYNLHFFVGTEFVLSDYFDESDIELNMSTIVSQLPRTTGRSYLSYIPGYDAIRIPTKVKDGFALETVSSSFFSDFSEEKILSPFVRIGNNTYDCRNEQFYDYVHSKNGSEIDAIKVAYDRFVKEAKEAGLKVQD